MPTKTITVCTTCGKKTCDGSRWQVVTITGWNTTTFHPQGQRTFEGPSENIDPAKLPASARVTCPSELRHVKELKGKKLGDEVTLEYIRGLRPYTHVVRKIED